MNGTKIEGTEGSSSFLTMSFSGVGLRSFLENCTEKRREAHCERERGEEKPEREELWKRSPQKARERTRVEAWPRRGNRKGHAEAKIDQANKSTGRMPWH